MLPGAGLFPSTAYLPSLIPHAALFSLKAVYSRSTSSAQSLATAYADALPDLDLANIGIYSDAADQDGGLDELLKGDDVEAVLIALPIVMQAGLVERCLEAGKHVLRFVQTPMRTLVSAPVLGDADSGRTRSLV